MSGLHTGPKVIVSMVADGARYMRKLASTKQIVVLQAVIVSIDQQPLQELVEQRSNEHTWGNASIRRSLQELKNLFP